MLSDTTDPQQWNRSEINVGFFFSETLRDSYTGAHTHLDTIIHPIVSRFFYFKEKRIFLSAYNFPYFRSEFHRRSDPTISTATYFFFIYLGREKILPVLFVLDRVTVGQSQDGFSRSENGSRAVFPTVRNRGLYHSLLSCACGECARRVTSRRTFDRPRLAGRRTSIYFKCRPAHACRCSGLAERP